MMKKIQLFIFLGIVGMLSQVQGQEMTYKTATAHMNTNKSTLTFENRRIDVGTISQNVPVEVEFQFVNNGTEPVFIKNVSTTCGCTAAKHSQAPVLPGQSSSLTVSYNAKKTGVFRKSVKIETSDEENPTILLIAGEVI